MFRMASRERDSSQAGATTLSEMAAARIRADIIAGVLRPSGKLRIDVLKARYGVGGSPLREALSRLVSDGLVRAESQRGFSVAAISRADLLDITLTRQIFEPEALRLAMRHGDEVWESEVLAAFHRFARRTEQDRASRRSRPKDLTRWDEAHKDFHRSLIAACGSARLPQIQEALYDQTRRYRALLFDHEFEAAEMIAEHRVLLDAVLSRDEHRACEALRRHLALTADVVLGAGGDLEGRASETESLRVPAQQPAN